MNSAVAIHTSSTTYGYNECMALESFGSYERACKGKRKYTTEADARHAAKDLRKRVGSKLKPYQCSFCDMWHIGHLRRIIVNGRKEQVKV